MSKHGRNDNLLYFSGVFSDEVVALCRKLRKRGTEKELISQLLKAGTSVGANVSEAQHAQSKKDFISKLEIAAKERREVEHWFGVLYRVGDIPNKEYLHFQNQWIRLQYLLTSSIMTAKKNLEEEEKRRKGQRDSGQKRQSQEDGLGASDTEGSVGAEDITRL